MEVGKGTIGTCPCEEGRRYAVFSKDARAEKCLVVRKEGLAGGLCGWSWNQIFLRGKEKVSGEQLWLGSLQSCGISKTLSSPLKEASSGFGEKAERLQKATPISLVLG